jgi:hypothetical protein
VKSSRFIPGAIVAATAGIAAWWMRPVPRPDAAAGGLRTFAADVTWLRANDAWERRDARRTEALLRLTVALDPQPLYFWLNGARMMAYDFPSWRSGVGVEGRGRDAGRRRRIETEDARRALEFLERARARHPASAALWIERGNIELNALHDPGAAAESYRRASEQPDAPYFTARVYAELLRRLGRKAEALAWLEALLPRLPQDDEAAAADLVLARIRALERELGVPAERAYAPGENGWRESARQLP